MRKRSGPDNVYIISLGCRPSVKTFSSCIGGLDTASKSSSSYLLGCRSGKLTIMPRLMLICEIPIDSGASGLSNLISTWRILGSIVIVMLRTYTTISRKCTGRKKNVGHVSVRERPHSRVASREMDQSFERPVFCTLPHHTKPPWMTSTSHKHSGSSIQF